MRASIPRSNSRRRCREAFFARLTHDAWGTLPTIATSSARRGSVEQESGVEQVIEAVEFNSIIRDDHASIRLSADDHAVSPRLLHLAFIHDRAAM